MTADEWNLRFPPGSHPKAKPIETVTTSKAWTLSSGDPVVSLESGGRSGGAPGHLNRHAKDGE